MKDTSLDVGMYSDPFTMEKIFLNFAGVNPVKVQADGSFAVNLEISPDFEKKYSGEIIEVRIKMTAVSQCCEKEDLYGEYGENLTGPFVYKHEIFDELYQKLQASVYVLVGDEVKEYDIETPERVEVPEDYGETEIWIEPELTNDHRFIYIHGKSNLLEGTEIKGAYYAQPNDVLPQESGLPYRTYVQPDGTFLLRVGYESFTNEGILKVYSRPDNEIHDPSHVIYETYGENFEKMSGEYVKDYEEGGKMIEFIYEPEALGIEAPKHTSITEEDGELKVQVPDDVLFDFDKSDLKADAQQVLEEVIDLLESLEDNTSIEINGHTDNQGDEEYNVVLSEKRAESVEAYLQENGNLDHLNISMNGYGMERPIASNEDEEGREKNRRVEIVINP